jgi:hypothetical protein
MKGKHHKKKEKENCKMVSNTMDKQYSLPKEHHSKFRLFLVFSHQREDSSWFHCGRLSNKQIFPPTARNL